MPNTTLEKPSIIKAAPEAANSRRPVHAVLRFSLEITLVTLAAFLLLEGIFAWAGVGEQECLKIDDYLGFSLFPNKDITWRREGFSRVRFNSHGMQDREYMVTKAPDTTRIAVVGDSYVEALQVDRNKNFLSLLEKSLNSNSQKNRNEKIQVMNFGVQAHNLAQSYLYLKNSVLNFSPDMVIVPYRTDATYLLPPDIKRGFLGARPNFFVDDKGNLIEDRTVQELWLKSRAAKRMKTTAWLREHSNTWGVIGTAMEALSNWKAKGGLLENFLNPQEKKELPGLQDGGVTVLEDKTESGWTRTSKTGEDSIKATWPIADALIREMDALCKEKNSRMILVRMPGVRGHVSSLETRLLEKSARDYNIPFLDLTDSFHKQLKAGEELFIKTHMTEAGHRIVAEELFEFLNSNHTD